MAVCYEFVAHRRPVDGRSPETVNEEDKSARPAEVESVQWAVKVEREPFHTVRLPPAWCNAQNAHTRLMAAAMREAFGR